jgi:hypothetical protein
MSGVFTVAVGLTNSAVVVSSVVITGIFFIIITIQYLQSWLRARGKKALEQREKDREEQRESDYDAYLQRTNPRVAQQRRLFIARWTTHATRQFINGDELETLLADLGFATPSDRAAVIDTLHGVIIVRRFLQLGEYPQYHIFDDCIGKAAAVVTDKLVKLDSNEAMLAASEPVVQPIRRTPGVSTRPPSSDPPRSGLVPVQALQRHAQPLQQAAVRVQPNVGS